MLENLDRKKMKVLIITIIVFFSIAPVAFWNDFYLEKNGYSFLWLALLYIIGGCLRKMKLAERMKKWQLVLLYIVPVVVAWASNLIIRANGIKNINSEFLIIYVSPCVLLSAMALVLLFAKINIKKKLSIRLIKLFAASSFSVYLIHVHPLIWKYVMEGSTKFIADFPAVGMVGAILGISVGIYIVCSCIDLVRIGIFKLVGKGFSKALK